MTTCDKMAPLISEYVSGTLAPKDAWLVQSHITQCAECAKVAQDFQTVSETLRNIPSKQLSSGFDDELAKRLAQLPRRSNKDRFSIGRLVRTSGFWWRTAVPAFGLCTALGAIVAVGYLSPTNRSINTGPNDAMLQQCIQQHRIDAAAQPLSDLSAQALTTRPDAQDPKTDALSDTSDSDNL